MSEPNKIRKWVVEKFDGISPGLLGIVKGLSKYYWYWVLLRPFQNIGIDIGYSLRP